MGDLPRREEPLKKFSKSNIFEHLLELRCFNKLVVKGSQLGFEIRPDELKQELVQVIFQRSVLLANIGKHFRGIFKRAVALALAQQRALLHVHYQIHNTFIILNF